MVVHDGPEESDDHDAEESLRRATRTDGGDHGIEEPEAGVFESPVSGQVLALGGFEDEEDEIAGDNVG